MSILNLGINEDVPLKKYYVTKPNTDPWMMYIVKVPFHLEDSMYVYHRIFEEIQEEFGQIVDRNSIRVRSNKGYMENFQLPSPYMWVTFCTYAYPEDIPGWEPFTFSGPDL